MSRIFAALIGLVCALPLHAQSNGLWDELRGIAGRSGAQLEARLLADSPDRVIAQGVTARLAQGVMIQGDSLRIDADQGSLRLTLPPETMWTQGAQQARVTHEGTVSIRRDGQASGFDLRQLTLTNVLPGEFRAERVSGQVHSTQPETLFLTALTVTASPEIWALANLSTLASESLNLSVIARRTAQNGVEIDDLRLTFGPVEIALQGNLETLPGVIDEILAGVAPPARAIRGGTILADLRGLESFSAQLNRSGSLAPDQVFFLQALIALIGPPVGPDHYRATLGFTPEGNLTLNGLVFGR